MSGRVAGLSRRRQVVLLFAFVMSLVSAVGAPRAAADTIWPSTAVPAVASQSDPNAVSLGVKFRSDVNGFITGIRFYKGSANTGTHVGSLWTSGGQLLATATFTNETASGWQQVNFATPAAITANTVYVASYHAPNGGYAANSSTTLPPRASIRAYCMRCRTG